MAEEELLDKIKKLSPRERIEKLKEIEKKDKEEIEKAQALLQESEAEVQREEETKKQIPIPQLKAVNIDELFAPDEKELFKAKREVSEKPRSEEKVPVKPKEKVLEEIAEAEKSVLSFDEEKAHAQYLSNLSQAPAKDLYSEVKDIYDEVKQSGYMTASQQEKLNNIHYANQRKMNAAEAGQYSNITKEAAKAMVVTEKIKNWLQDSYGRSQNW